MKLNKSISIKILVGISLFVLGYHLLIIFRIIPYDITWGGRLKTDEEMYVFECISITVNLFFIYVLLQKGNFIKAIFSEKILSAILWFFFAIFAINTVGNIVAKTTLEQFFTIVTLINAVLLWRINKSTESETKL